MRIKPDVLDQLKKPLGILIPNKDVSAESLSKYLTNAKKIISVGDRTSKRLISFGVMPDISVIDGLERRKRSYGVPVKERLRSLCPNAKPVVLSGRNPKGGISEECMAKIKKSLKIGEHVVLEIIGEEDLLVLPYILFGEDGTVIFYGQPLSGMVVVRVSNTIRLKTKKLIGLVQPK